MIFLIIVLEKSIIGTLKVSVNEARDLLKQAATRTADLGRSLSDTAIFIHFLKRRLILQSFHDALLIAFDADADDQVSTCMLQLVRHWTDEASVEFTAHLLQLLSALKVDIYSLAIEEKLGVQSASISATEQNMTLAKAYQRFRDNADLSGSITASMGSSVFEERVMICRILLLTCWNMSVELQSVMKVLSALSSEWHHDDPMMPLMFAIFKSCTDGLIDSEMDTIKVTECASSCDKIIQDSSKWKDSSIQVVAKLFWTVQLRKLSEKHQLGILNMTHQRCEEFVEKSIHEDALTHLKANHLSFVAKDGHRQIECYTIFSSVLFGKDDYAKGLVLLQVQALILFLTTRCMDLIRRMKNREEDVPTTSGSTSFASINRLSHGSTKDLSSINTLSAAPRKDIQSFLELVDLVYRERENAGVELLDPRRRGFLKIVYDDRLPLSAKRAYFDMLASIAGGDQASVMVYEMLAGLSSSLSWDWIIGGLDWYCDELNKNADAGSYPEISADDLAMIEALLRVVRVIAQYSSTARATLQESSNIVKRLFNLLSTRIPKDLKAPILDTLAAFALTDGTAGSNLNVAWYIWSLLEQTQIVPKNMQGGIIYDLEMIEAKEESYPETRSFLKLVNTLLYPYSAIPSYYALKSLNYSIEGPLTNAIALALPDAIGVFGDGVSDIPMISRYTKYVIDLVLCKSMSRAYCVPEEKWIVIGRCLHHCELALYSFGMDCVGPLLESLEKYTAITAGKTLVITTVDTQRAEFYVHCKRIAGQPGFLVASALLSGGRMLQIIIDLCSQKKEVIHRSALLSEVVLRSLRLVMRALDIQSMFLRSLLPALHRCGKNLVNSFNSHLDDKAVKSIVGGISCVPLDQSFIYAPDTVVNLADLINCNDDEIAFVSQSIVSFLSSVNENGANNVARVLVQSPRLADIMAGYASRLQCEDFGPTLSNEVPNSYINMTRQSIVAMFLNILSRRDDGCTLAHLLLGYDCNSLKKTIFQSPADWPSETRKACFYVLIEALIDRISTDGTREATDFDRNGNDLAETPTSELPFFIRQSDVYVGMMQVLVHLCQHTEAGILTMRYLRYGEDFFYRNIKALETKTFGYHEWSFESSDMFMSTSLGSLVKNQLLRRSCVLELASLEMQAAASTRETRFGKRICQCLFGMVFDSNAQKSGYVNFSQSTAKQLLDDTFSIVIPVADTQEFMASLQLFRDFDPTIFRRSDDQGCEVYDVVAIYEALTRQLADSNNAGSVRAGKTARDAEAEIAQISQWFMHQNNCCRMMYAKSHALHAWKDAIIVAVSLYYDYSLLETREQFLLTTSQVVLMYLKLDMHLQDREAFANVLLTLLTRYADDCATLDVSRLSRVNADKKSGTPQFCIDQLLNLLESVIYVLLKPELKVSTRGNLYAAATHLLRVISPASNESINSIKSHQHISKQATLSSKASGGSRTSLMNGAVSIISSNLDGLVGVLSADSTLRENDVWRTVAFLFLQSIITLSLSVQSSELFKALMSDLSRGNILRLLVDEIRTSDCKSIEEMIANESEGTNFTRKLNSLVDTDTMLIYEAKMQVLLRLGETVDGAVALVDCRIMDVFSQCKFLDMMPSRTLDSYAYDRATSPVLKIVASLVGTIAGKHSGIVTLLKEFVERHHNMIYDVLRDNALILTEESVQKLSTVVGILSYLPEHDSYLSSDLAGELCSLVLSLFSKYLYFEEWSKLAARQHRLNEVHASAFELLPPVRDVNADMFKPGSVSRIRLAVNKLQRHCLYYIGLKISAGQPLFSPQFATTHSDRRSGHQSRSHLVPALGSLDAFLKETLAIIKHQQSLIISASQTSLSTNMMNHGELKNLFDSLQQRITSTHLNDAELGNVIKIELDVVTAKCFDAINMQLVSLEMSVHLMNWHIDHYLKSDAPFVVEVSPRILETMHVIKSLKVSGDPGRLSFLTMLTRKTVEVLTPSDHSVGQ